MAKGFNNSPTGGEDPGKDTGQQQPVAPAEVGKDTGKDTGEGADKNTGDQPSDANVIAALQAQIEALKEQNRQQKEDSDKQIAELKKDNKRLQQAYDALLQDRQKANQEGESNPDQDKSGEQSADGSQKTRKLGLTAMVGAMLQSGMEPGAAGKSGNLDGTELTSDQPKEAASDQGQGDFQAGQASQASQTGAKAVAPIPVVPKAERGGHGRAHQSDNDPHHDKEGKNGKNKISMRSKVVAGVAAAALALAAFIGGAGIHQGNQAETAAAATLEQIDNNTQNANAVAAPDAQSASDDLNSLVDQANQTQPGWFGHSFFGPSQETVDNLHNAANGEAVSQAQDTYQQKQSDWQKAQEAGVTVEQYTTYNDKATAAGMDIPAYMDLEQKANNLGVSIEDYNSYSKAASDMKIPVEEVKHFADYYGIPANALGTPAAEGYMRDQMKAQHNVGETLEGDNTTSPEMMRDQIVFCMYNNPGVLAQNMNAYREWSKNPNGGLFGLIDPDMTQQYYASYHNNQNDGQYSEAWRNDFNQMRDAFLQAGVSIREATSRAVYSYGIYGDYIVVTKNTENSGGNQWILVVDFNNDGNSDVNAKTICGYQITAAGYAAPRLVTPVKRTPRRNTPPTTTTTPPNKITPPTDEPPAAKDPTANDKQQNDAENFGDNAQSTDDKQTWNGQTSDEADKTGGNTDGDASNGSEVVPDTDESGNNNNKNDQDPGFQDWN